MNCSLFTCDSLWLPPCPRCSLVWFFRPSSEDRLESPGFHLARNTSKKYDANYWMLLGCPHAAAISQEKGPIANRLKLAAAWRRKVREMTETCYTHGYNEQVRAVIMRRLGHPEIDLEAARAW